MNIDELCKYIEDNPKVNWVMDNEGVLFLRHDNYQVDEVIRIEPKALSELTPGALDRIIHAGRNIDHITRITGYFSRVSGWNKGKLGELQDRSKTEIN